MREGRSIPEAPLGLAEALEPPVAGDSCPLSPTQEARSRKTRHRRGKGRVESKVVTVKGDVWLLGDH